MVIHRLPRTSVASDYYSSVRPGCLNDVTSRLPEFESKEKVANETQVRQLALMKSKNGESQELGKRLLDCNRIFHTSPVNRYRHVCGSAACPMCFRQFRRWMFGELSYLSRHFMCAYILTIVYYDEAMTDREFYEFNPVRLTNRLRQQLKRVGFEGVCIGGMEIDKHTETGLWLPHFHLLVLGDDFPLDEFKSRFFTNHGGVAGRSAKVDRPVHMTKLRNKARQLSYLLKFYCSRVEAYSDRSGRRRTIKGRLRPSKLRLSLRVFDRIGYNQLLFKYGCRRVNSEIRITPVTDRFGRGG